MKPGNLQRLLPFTTPKTIAFKIKPTNWGNCKYVQMASELITAVQLIIYSMVPHDFHPLYSLWTCHRQLLAAEKLPTSLCYFLGPLAQQDSSQICLIIATDYPLINLDYQSWWRNDQQFLFFSSILLAPKLYCCELWARNHPKKRGASIKIKPPKRLLDVRGIYSKCCLHRNELAAQNSVSN